MEERLGRLAPWQQLALAAGALVAVGFVPAPGMSGSPYVLVPYALAIVFLGLSVARLARLSSPLDPRKKTGTSGLAKSLRRRLALGVVACATTAAGEVVCLVLKGNADVLPWSALVLALLAVAAYLLADLRTRLDVPAAD